MTTIWWLTEVTWYLQLAVDADHDGRCLDERGRWTWQILVSADKARRLERRAA